MRELGRGDAKVPFIGQGPGRDQGGAVKRGTEKTCECLDVGRFGYQSSAMQEGLRGRGPGQEKVEAMGGGPVGSLWAVTSQKGRGLT